MGVEVPDDENIVRDSEEEGEVGFVVVGGGGAGGDVDVDESETATLREGEGDALVLQGGVVGEEGGGVVVGEWDGMMNEDE